MLDKLTSVEALQLQYDLTFTARNAAIDFGDVEAYEKLDDDCRFIRELVGWRLEAQGGCNVPYELK